MSELLQITISGHPGSGTSTLVSGISKTKNWDSINGGDIFRNEAKKRNLSLPDFERLCAIDSTVDESLDDILKMKMKDNQGPEIVESRLCGWWAFKLNLNCVRIWLHASEEVRAQRVMNRESLSRKEAVSQNKARLEVDRLRFNDMYGLDPEDMTPYTHVIDASNSTAQQVLDEVIEILEEMP